MSKLEGYDFWTKTLKSASYVVAPMVDQSELAWRLLSRRHGAHLCYTPMYHAASFVNDAKYRAESLQSCEEDRPLIIQFCANTVETFVEAALLAQDHCDAVDLNLGCPQGIAKKGHYGAFLQDEWDLLKEMVSACHKKVKVPITCKVRVFETTEKTIEYAKMLEGAGCQLLTVHGRTRDQKGPLTGVASWSHIKAVRDHLKIPVFANGNIQYLPDVKRCMEETGVVGVMTAEGNLHNPALFEGISPPVWQMMDEYLEIVKQYPCRVSSARGHLFKMLHHVLLRHTEFREQLATAKDLKAINEMAQDLKKKLLSVTEHLSPDSPEILTDQKLPYWLCQPYVRLSPEEAIKKLGQTNEEGRKRHAEKVHDPNEISRKQMKRRKKYPHKNFDLPKRVFDMCQSCKSPRGLSCDFQLCRPCCDTKTFKENIKCVGHTVKRNRRDKRAKYSEEDR